MKNATTEAMLDAAKKIGSGEDVHADATMPWPKNPDQKQSKILAAIYAFQSNRQCRGWDLLDEAEVL